MTIRTDVLCWLYSDLNCEVLQAALYQCRAIRDTTHASSYKIIFTKQYFI